MRPSSLLVALGALGAVAARSRSEYDNLRIVDNFSKQFLWPNSKKQADAINSTLFSEDVHGTVDATTNFDGRELNTEYMFGLFGHLDTTGPSFLGIPKNYTVTALLVENDNVAASVVFDFEYPYINRTFPLELITFFTLNDQQQITEYTTTFRRWPWASEVILPLQVPAMAEWIGLDKWDNDTQVWAQYYANQTCTGAQNYCYGDNKQYDSFDHWMSHLLDTKEIGDMWHLGGDNIACRFLHVGMLELRPEIHCDHVGPSGGDMCIKRDYFEVVTADHFPHGFIGPLTPNEENKPYIGHIKMTGSSHVNSGIEILMERENQASWDTTLYAANGVYLFVAIIIAAKLLEAILTARDPSLVEDSDELSLRQEKRKHRTVLAILTLVIGAIAFILEFAAIPAVFGDETLVAVQRVRFAALLITTLYLFELSYGFRLRPIETFYKLATIFVLTASVTAFQYSLRPIYLVATLSLLFVATTKGLLCASYLAEYYAEGRAHGLYKWTWIQIAVFDVFGLGLIIYYAIAGHAFVYVAFHFVFDIIFWIGVALFVYCEFLVWQFCYDRCQELARKGHVALPTSTSEEDLNATVA
ncbi:uncharacterized protein LOC62_01G000284 [Vanrija pseudolonga]|uniref:Uncharacterized protein n=1 Tax=Vanrija pseudolonga TaxID=143232 RepID=A0AAF0XZA5_9TREE|nr:hypothetical protein LOC62_01G000284 [Vanrija pseudolonga]